MSLIDKKWTRVPVHTVVAEFLRAERHKLAGSPPEVLALIDSPNIADPLENHVRLRYLCLIRRQLIGEIPPDTQWFAVQSVAREELRELHVIARCGFDEPCARDRNELFRVALRRPEVLRTPLLDWDRPILWGHDRAGPFTIIDGNHRLIACASHNSTCALPGPVLVGLSAMPCFWHIFDPPNKLVNDLWA